MNLTSLNDQKQPHIAKLRITGAGNGEREELLKKILQKADSGIERVDVNAAKGLIRIIGRNELDIGWLNQAISGEGFSLQTEENSAAAREDVCEGIMRLAIEGMHCASCELTIERKFKKIKGVEKVDVDAAKGCARVVYNICKPDMGELQAAIAQDGYKIKEITKVKNYESGAAVNDGRPTLIRLVGLFALVLVLGRMISRLGLIKTNVDLGGSPSFWAVFLLGLVAASSSCIAVSGGLLLSSAAKFNERYGKLIGLARMKPVFLFVAGRVASYGILGALIGYLGAALSPSPFITGAITVVAAVYMLIMGMEMLRIAPPWLKGILPRMPKSFSHKVLDAEGHEHPSAPFFLGAATFFLPCGFTQALQLYALTTKSAAESGLLLFAFALGTAPSLLALGWASGSLKGKAGKFFFQFSGALVITLGLWNIQNGFSIAGYPLALPRLDSQALSGSGRNRAGTGDPNVIFDGKQQIVNMAVGRYGYTPNSFTIRAGVPTKWIVDGTNAGGCANALQAPKLGIRKLLVRGENVFEFTPDETGVIPFSCSMGMYRGQFVVVPGA